MPSSNEQSIHFSGRFGVLLGAFILHYFPNPNMERENHPFEKEIIFQTLIWGFHVSFGGCITVVCFILSIIKTP